MLQNHSNLIIICLSVFECEINRMNFNFKFHMHLEKTMFGFF